MFTVLVHFWALFTPGKSKILGKSKISPKTKSSGLSNSINNSSNKRLIGLKF